VNRILYDSPAGKVIRHCINCISKPAEERKRTCWEGLAWLRPTADDWLTPEERAEIQRLQSMIRMPSQAEAVERVKIKRERRRNQ